jgi:hypothetical protein
LLKFGDNIRVPAAGISADGHVDINLVAAEEAVASHGLTVEHEKADRVLRRGMRDHGAGPRFWKKGWDSCKFVVAAEETVV